MTYERNYGITLFIIFLFLIWYAAVCADFSGKVVAVKDGDTLEVMKEGVAGMLNPEAKEFDKTVRDLFSILQG